MGLERITPAVLGDETESEKNALIAEYEKKREEMEKLLAKTHKLEEDLGIKDKNRHDQAA